MKFGDIPDIWSVDTTTLPNSVKSKLFFERAKIVTARALADPATWGAALNGARFSRRYLSKAIGCGTSAMSQNPHLRAHLLRVDANIAARRLDADVRARTRYGVADTPSSLPTDRAAFTESPPRKPTRIKSGFGLITLTNETCVINGSPWPGIPTLIWPEGYDEDVNDYLRQRVIQRDITTSSAEEYAKVLRLFIRRCRKAGRPWRSVDDQFLIIWREEMREKQISYDRINYCLNVVFLFLLWAERDGRLRYHVGAYLRPELPQELSEIKFPISARERLKKFSSGRTYVTWSTPLLMKIKRAHKKQRHTPTEDELKRFHEIVTQGTHGVRNSVIASWIEESGGRPSSVLRIKTSQLPSYDQISEIIEEDRLWEIKVRQKGDPDGFNPENRTWGNLLATPDLLLNTKLYIDGERKLIVERHRNENVGYTEPEEVFLSETYTRRTRGVLQTDSLTAIGISAFRRAGVTDAGPHRIRARFAVRLIEELVDSLFTGQLKLGLGSDAIETLMTMASERMSHMSPLSIRAYINFVLSRRLRNSEAYKAGNLSSRLRQLERREMIVTKRLAPQSDLQDIARLLAEGKLDRTATALRMLADTLEERGESCPAGA